MLKIIQDQTTNICLGSVQLPIGTVFKGLCVFTMLDGDSMVLSITWTMNDGIEIINSLQNIPYVLRVPITEENRAKYNVALNNDSEISVDKIEQDFTNLDGKIQIVDL